MSCWFARFSFRQAASWQTDLPHWGWCRCWWLPSWSRCKRWLCRSAWRRRVRRQQPRPHTPRPVRYGLCLLCTGYVMLSHTVGEHCHSLWGWVRVRVRVRVTCGAAVACVWSRWICSCVSWIRFQSIKSTHNKHILAHTHSQQHTHIHTPSTTHTHTHTLNNTHTQSVILPPGPVVSLSPCIRGPLPVLGVSTAELAKHYGLSSPLQLWETGSRLSRLHGTERVTCCFHCQCF